MVKIKSKDIEMLQDTLDLLTELKEKQDECDELMKKLELIRKQLIMVK